MDVKFGNFEWDNNKEAANIKKHGVDFRTASLVFKDEYHIEIFDGIHSLDEKRYIAIGTAGNISVIAQVVYTPRENENVIRIISARKATKAERNAYYGELY